MAIAAVQFRATKGDKPGSLARLCRWAERAAQGAGLVVLPEMAATGYVFRSRAAIDRVAENARGPTFSALSPIARAHRTWLVCGFPERDADRRFNSALVINPAGELHTVYRKTLLFAADELWASPGDTGYPLIDTDLGRLTVGICMDINDEAFTRWLRAQQPELCAFPTNWVEELEPVHAYWQERLTGVRGLLVAGNSYGVDGPVRFSGRSAIVSAARVHRSAFWCGNAVVRWGPPATPRASG